MFETKTVSEIINEYKKDLKDSLESGIVKDPALFWAGRMSQLSYIVCRTSLGGLGNIISVLESVRQEYDQEIFSRIK